jgi:hypothetical protein
MLQNVLKLVSFNLEIRTDMMLEKAEVSVAGKNHLEPQTAVIGATGRVGTLSILHSTVLPIFLFISIVFYDL